VITVLFALIFKYLPDVKTQWRHVWIGAVLTAVLFTIGKFGLGWYLGRKGAVSVYGAAGSLVALLIWVYYSAQILFFGAEFTQVYARQHLGQDVPAAENAVPVTEEQRAQEGMPRKKDVEDAARETRLPKPVVKVTAGVSKTTAVAALVGGYVAGKMMKRPKVVYPAAEVAPWRKIAVGLPTRARRRWMRERARVIREVAERNGG
jgi:membrane protein